MILVDRSAAAQPGGPSWNFGGAVNLLPRRALAGSRRAKLALGGRGQGLSPASATFAFGIVPSLTRSFRFAQAPTFPRQERGEA
jgi:hypothetical protein